MIRRVSVLALVIFCCAVSPLSAQQCVPREVQNLVLFANGTLTWTTSPFEECYITHYQITAYRYDHELFQLEVETTSAELAFVTFCDAWMITVYAMFLDIASHGHLLIARRPLPSDADLTLTSLEISNVDDVPRLSWEVEEQEFKGCADQFRISVDNQDSGEITDIYVNDKFLDLDFVSSCISYEFGVRALFGSRPAQEGPLIGIDYDAKAVEQGPPVLETISASATTVDTTWILESRSKNACPLSRFYVDGGQYFNFSFSIADTPDRHPVPIHLYNLLPNSLYLMRVYIGNNAGVSSPAVVGVQTLDLDPDV